VERADIVVRVKKRIEKDLREQQERYMDLVSAPGKGSVAGDSKIKHLSAKGR